MVTALVVAVTFLFHVLFSRTISNLTVEIMAAVLGVVLVVASGNWSSVAALVASEKLLEALAEFIERVSREGQLKPKEDRQEDKGTYRHVIQQMREDLAVVEGDVKRQVGRLIAKSG